MGKGFGLVVEHLLVQLLASLGRAEKKILLEVQC